MKLQLNTLQNTRRSYARVIRESVAGNIPQDQAKGLCYMLGGYLAYLRAEQEAAIEERLSRLEKIAEGKK